MANNRRKEEKTENAADAVAESRIDSAFSAITKACDSLLVHKVPEMIERLKVHDSTVLQQFIDSTTLYKGENKKVERVIRQLKADCDSSLLKETYRRWRLLQGQGPHRYKKKKA